MAAGPSRYVKVLLRCHYDCYTVHHEYLRICTVRLQLVTTDADQARMQPRMTTVELRYTTIFQDFHAVQWGPIVSVPDHCLSFYFTQDIVQFVCLLYTLSQFVQLEKCVGSLMSLPFPLCSHYPLIDGWSQSCIGVSFEYNAETTCISFVLSEHADSSPYLTI